MTCAPPSIRKRIHIAGVVQGVGFRPFVYRIARLFEVGGHVLNRSDGVVIEAEGAERAVCDFLAQLKIASPPLARIDSIQITDVEPHGESEFEIRRSIAESGKFALVPPDIATCADCSRDFTTPHNRRYNYPFTNCTNCGPRYSIIGDVPYDRAKTTMAEFTLCPRCQSEYDDPGDRRFHAEPNACPDCGPSLVLVSGEELQRGVPEFGGAQASTAILAEARAKLAAGEILAIKGLGGFHLSCDARNDAAVTRLRERKRRSGKAFAIMVRDLETAERLCHVSPAARDLLCGTRRPIVLLPRRDSSTLSPQVAPGTNMLGVMLPYTPMHHLLFAESSILDALVMTSGNQSEEPIVCSNSEAWPCLHGLADAFLLHNRAIQMRVDDSVLQVFENREYPIRRSRGYAPEPVDVGRPLPQILAVGAELKNSLCLTKDHYAILSQHIGDLENLETMEFYREMLAHLKRFFRVSPEAVAHDLHPNYLTTRYALRESGLPAIGVQHHHAHIASCMADNGLTGHVIGVAFDGTGYGTDGQIWGGEFLTCDFRSFERHAHLRYVTLAGGDQAVRQPWRSALAWLRESLGAEALRLDLPFTRAIPEKQIALIAAMIDRGIQTVNTSSCGRLFDAVSSLLGVRHEVTYEGQGAIELEMIATHADSSYSFEFDESAVDLRPMVAAIVRDLQCGVASGEISAKFHRTLGDVIVDGCLRLRRSEKLNRVCLSGGTFHNLRLLQYTVSALRARGFEVFTHRRVPTNDGGLSLGQAMVAAVNL
jgi:hydrogenase maturation protein HypF